MTERTPLLAALLSLALMLSPAWLLLDGQPAHAQDRPPVEDPDDLFSKGVEHYRNKDYRKAISVFRKLVEIDPNPIILYNIGRCHEELGELPDAVKYYERALLLGGLPEGAKAEAIKRLEKLEPQLDTDGANKAIAESSRETAAMVLKLATARALDRANEEGRKKTDLDKVAPPPTPERGAMTIFGAGAVILGISSLSAGGFFFSGAVENLDRQKDLQVTFDALRSDALTNKNPDSARDAITTANEINTLADDIDDDQTLASAFFAVGGALVITGLVLVIIDTPGDEDSKPDDDSGLRLTPLPGGVQLIGTW